MGCFLGCFGSSKDQKRRKQRYKLIHRDQKPKIRDIVKANNSLEESIKESPTRPFPEAREKTEVPPLSVKRRKKVTFDTNITTYEHIQVYDSTESLLEKTEKGDTFPKSEPSPNMPNYRYGNCIESDDEIDDLDQEDYDFDEDEYGLSDEECYDDDDDQNIGDGDSIPSLESNRNVLRPVENLAQWKALKSKGTTRKLLNSNGQKEFTPKFENPNQETIVDTSLSNWLISLKNNTANNKRAAFYNTELERTTNLECKG